MRTLLTILTASLFTLSCLVITDDFINLTLIYWVVFASSYVFWKSFLTQKKTVSHHTS